MAALDQFQYVNAVIDAPYTHAQVVAPSDTVDLTYVSRALWVGVAGNVTAIMADGSTVLFANLTLGWHRLRVSRVMLTGTAATNMVAVS